MNGLMRKFDYERYFEQIKTMPEPIMMSELPKVKLNLKGIRRYAEIWYLDFEDVKYEAFHFSDGELANENKLKDSADYAAYKEANEEALPKFKFRKLMIDEFKNVLMPEIAPLID